MGPIYTTHMSGMDVDALKILGAWTNYSWDHLVGPTWVDYVKLSLLATGRDSGLG